MSKRAFFTLIVISAVSVFAVFANGEIQKSSSFKSSDEEVALDVQRVTGEVKLHLIVKNISQYDHIVIERSAETPDYFGKCKYISSADIKTESIDVVQVDRYPYAANKDVYYRIKTVTKNGIERAYPAVLLASSAQ